MHIDILEIRRMDKTQARQGKVVAFVDIMLDDIRINDFRLIYGDHENKYLRMPQLRFARDGEIKYMDIVELPKDIESAVAKAILFAFENDGVDK